MHLELTCVSSYLVLQGATVCWNIFDFPALFFFRSFYLFRWLGWFIRRLLVPYGRMPITPIEWRRRSISFYFFTAFTWDSVEYLSPHRFSRFFGLLFTFNPISCLWTLRTILCNKKKSFSLPCHFSPHTRSNRIWTSFWCDSHIAQVSASYKVAEMDRECRAIECARKRANGENCQNVKIVCQISNWAIHTFIHLAYSAEADTEWRDTNKNNCRLEITSPSLYGARTHRKCLTAAQGENKNEIENTACSLVAGNLPPGRSCRRPSVHPYVFGTFTQTIWSDAFR